MSITRETKSKNFGKKIFNILMKTAFYQEDRLYLNSARKLYSGFSKGYEQPLTAGKEYGCCLGLESF